jgi:hypothetical protein
MCGLISAGPLSDPLAKVVSKVLNQRVVEQATSIWHSSDYQLVNPLNAELNSICHLLVLLGNLKFMGHAS